MMVIIYCLPSLLPTQSPMINMSSVLSFSVERILSNTKSNSGSCIHHQHRRSLSFTSSSCDPESIVGYSYPSIPATTASTVRAGDGDSGGDCQPCGVQQLPTPPCSPLSITSEPSPLLENLSGEADWCLLQLMCTWSTGKESRKTCMCLSQCHSHAPPSNVYVEQMFLFACTIPNIS